MSDVLVPLLVGSTCYALATAFEIRFTNNTTVPTAAALAPAVCLVALGGLSDSYLLALAPTAAVILLLATRRSVYDVVWHVTLFGVVAATVHGLGFLGLREYPLVRALIGGSLYLLGRYVGQRVRADSALLAREDRKTWLLLHGVLVCACGLTALGVDEMDWPAFIAMALVLLLTKREFEAFALSRTAYEQTMKAIGRLKSLEAPRA